MNCQSVEDVFQAVKDRQISFIQFWFTDVLGFLKSFAVRPSELEEALTEGMGFDGSSVEGFARIEESDMIAKPDPTTFQLVPWRNDDKPVARLFCDIRCRMEPPMPAIPGMCSSGCWTRSRRRAIRFISARSWNFSIFQR